MPLLPYNTIAVRNERTYITKETTFGTFVAPANGNCTRSTKCMLTPQIPIITRRDKTGSLSQVVGIKGRITGTFEIEMDFTPNGIVGTVPDANILIASAFGQDPVVGASPVTITSAANVTTALVATVASTATLTSGQAWVITNVVGAGITSGNTYTITVLSATTFRIEGVTASGTYTTTSAAATNPGVIYTLSDAPYTFDLWSYRNVNGDSTLANLEQRVAGSCVTTSLEISFGQDFAVLTARGDCLAVNDTGYFSSSSTAEKGGLGSFPAEPLAPTTNGYPSPGFVGLATTDFATLAEIKTGTITINTGRRLIRDSFGSYTATGIESGERTVMIAITTDDTDSVPLAALKLASKTKKPVTYGIQIGNVPGNEWRFGMSNLVLNPPALEEPALRYQARFTNAQAFASTYTAKDEVSLVAQ